MNDDPTDVFQIDDPQIDALEIARRVKANLRVHDLDENLQFPEFTITPPQFEDDKHLPPPLYHDLEQAASTYGQVGVQLQPLASRLPLLARLKHAFHRLVVYYVNLLGERQIIVNGALLRALNQVVTRLNRSQAEVVALRREVAELRARLEQLEKDRDG